MVDGQIHTAGVVSPAILSAFENTPREIFVPEKTKDIAYSDKDVSISRTRFLMEPMIHAKIIQAIQPQSTDVALDIAVGTGYSSAILSTLVTTVVALEADQKQIDKAAKQWNSLSACNIVGMTGDLTKGVPEQAPFNIIIINGAVEHIPQALIDQLAEGGRLMTIVRKKGAHKGTVTLVQRSAENNFTTLPLFDAAVPLLPEFKVKEDFSF